MYDITRSKRRTLRISWQTSNLLDTSSFISWLVYEMTLPFVGALSRSLWTNLKSATYFSFNHRPGCETAAHGSEENCHMKCSACCIPLCSYPNRSIRVKLNIFLFPSVATEFCWKCNLEWHEGITCERAQHQAAKGKKKKTRQEKRVWFDLLITSFCWELIDMLS